jgi:small subunit ribosomal protein S20
MLLEIAKLGLPFRSQSGIIVARVEISKSRFTKEGFRFRRLFRLANIKSAIKSIRSDARKTMRNKPVRSSLKTYIKKAVGEIHSGAQEASLESVRAAISNLDKAAQKGIIHKNQAARRKSRLMKKYNAQFATTATTEE